MERHGLAGRLLILKEWEVRSMTTYELTTLVVGILHLIIDAVALFKNKKK